MTDDGKRLRRVWPDPGVPAMTRYKEMVRAYRDVAYQLQDKAEALQKALAAVDLRVLRFADVDLADKVQAMVDQLADNPVLALDRQYADRGEDWHVDEKPVFEYDDDEWVPTWVASELSEVDGARVSEAQINKLRQVGRLQSIWPNAIIGYCFRVGDVRGLRARVPTRGYQGNRHHPQSEKNPRGVPAAPAKKPRKSTPRSKKG